jgi:hypothetical protein
MTRCEKQSNTSVSEENYPTGNHIFVSGSLFDRDHFCNLQAKLQKTCVRRRRREVVTRHSNTFQSERVDAGSICKIMCWSCKFPFVCA